MIVGYVNTRIVFFNVPDDDLEDAYKDLEVAVITDMVINNYEKNINVVDDNEY